MGAHFTDQSVRVAQLVESIIRAGGDLEPPPVIAAAMGYAPDQGTRNTRIAAKLKTVEARRFNDVGLRIERAGTDPHTKNVLWRVTVDAANTASSPATAIPRA